MILLLLAHVVDAINNIRGAEIAKHENFTNVAREHERQQHPFHFTWFACLVAKVSYSSLFFPLQ